MSQPEKEPLQKEVAQFEKGDPEEKDGGKGRISAC